MKQHVTVVIVTYGDRYYLVEKVVNACLHQEISLIALVDNASTKSSGLLIDKLVMSDPKIKLIRNAENLGSAGGFFSGLSFVLDNIKTDYVWMLDDDNVPEISALKSLFDANKLVSENRSDVPTVMYSYRGDSWQDDRFAVSNGKIKGYKDNNFLGFNLIKFIESKLLSKKLTSEINYPIVRTYLGPYGGMLLPITVLKKVGLPNRDFYLYADDHEFSMRFNKIGVSQYLVYASKLIDFDRSFPRENRFFSKKSSDVKLFYSIRNHVFLSKINSDNSCSYFFNKLLYLLFFLSKSIPYFLTSPGHSISRLKLLLRAISDGENGYLGKIHDGEDGCVE